MTKRNHSTNHHTIWQYPKNKPVPTSVWYIRLLKRLITNINRNGLSYLILLMALYVLTPLPLQLNTWPVIRHRVTVLLELPLKAVDSAIASVGGK